MPASKVVFSGVGKTGTGRRLAEAVRARRLFDEVAVAFHLGEPRFDTVLDELTADLGPAAKANAEVFG